MKESIKAKIERMIKETEITTGSYFSMYFAKSRRAWVVHYAQTGKVEDIDLGDALDKALERLISERHTSIGIEFTMYN